VDKNDPAKIFDFEHPELRFECGKDHLALREFELLDLKFGAFAAEFFVFRQHDRAAITSQ
jgi:hypothetical protein